MVPPKDNIVSCKVAVKNRGICQSCGSLASCIAMGQTVGQWACSGGCDWHRLVWQVQEYLLKVRIASCNRFAA